MPVLPLVGSTITVSRSIFPAFSPASIMATPMRSLKTRPCGFRGTFVTSVLRFVLALSPRGLRRAGLDLLPPKLLALFVQHPARQVRRLALCDRDNDVAVE